MQPSNSSVCLMTGTSCDDAMRTQKHAFAHESDSAYPSTGVHPASIQWHRLADHWQQLCASLPDSAVPQSEPALPPAPLSPVGSPSALTTKAAYQDPAHRSFLLPNW
eukprot:1147367-Pelagomonas_calceolata.AAC.2